MCLAESVDITTFGILHGPSISPAIYYNLYFYSTLLLSFLFILVL